VNKIKYYLSRMGFFQIEGFVGPNEAAKAARVRLDLAQFARQPWWIDDIEGK
jgi:hypothetical protein